MILLFVTLVLIPLVLIEAFAHGTDKTRFQGIVLRAPLQVVAGILSVVLCYCASVGDTEVWNGEVTKKYKDTVSCEHSYSCNCRKTCSGSGTSQSCRETCDTCYEHTFDYDWVVMTSNNEKVVISRVDRQGTREPPRYTQVVLGEPTAIEHMYVNYIKADPDTLFRKQGLAEKYKGSFPKYPEVHDYYRLQRYHGPYPAAWGTGLDEINRALGASKQVNIMVVVSPHPDRDWFYGLQETWIGGKKNDAIVVVYVNDKGTVEWAEVMAWTDRKDFLVSLSAELAGKRFQPEIVLPIITDNVRAKYVRKPMKDYEYLEANLAPSALQWVITLIVCMFVAGVAYAGVLHHESRGGFRPRMNRY